MTILVIIGKNGGPVSQEHVSHLLCNTCQLYRDMSANIGGGSGLEPITIRATRSKHGTAFCRMTLCEAIDTLILTDSDTRPWFQSLSAFLTSLFIRSVVFQNNRAF